MNRRIDDALVETSGFAKTWNVYRQSRCRLDAQGIPTEDAETETGSKESDAASDTEIMAGAAGAASKFSCPSKTAVPIGRMAPLDVIIVAEEWSGSSTGQNLPACRLTPIHLGLLSHATTAVN
ncbi:hypothetical protein [Sphingobium sp. LF-16]|uniref:hypothetical protein n=1 Tax=Sphingobium sp. LF-16 TaxID=2185111 RepID=UPI0013DE2092|nr:hypothetical protein [Sphingobium sp. LF-16]